MQTYYMFGKYSSSALGDISSARTVQCSQLIEKMGGEIILMHALLGGYDLAFVINFESNARALQASLTLNRETGISFSTWPAIHVSDLDKIAAGG